MNMARKIESLIGNKFGSWKVIDFLEFRRSNFPYYTCECACGKIVAVNGYHLSSGRSTKCRSCAALGIRKFDDETKYCPVCNLWLAFDDFADEASSKSTNKKHGCCSICDTLRRHHLTKSVFGEILKRQNFCCAVSGCTSPPTAIDHDHKCCPGLRSCGKCIRGILFHNHNMGMGRFRDDPKELRSAALYLERYVGNSCANDPTGRKTISSPLP